jgi:hypothetical protein
MYSRTVVKTELNAKTLRQLSNLHTVTLDPHKASVVTGGFDRDEEHTQTACVNE